MMTQPLNVLVLRLFAWVLVLVGVLGFLLPDSMALTSGATPYNLFHIAFGILGLMTVHSKNLRAARVFNAVFGAIDVYQAMASALSLWPKDAFQWKAADDVLHIIIGAGLMALGLLADRSAGAPEEAR